MKQRASPTGLIITADDFGRHPAINQAVELAHRNGVLTAASLMMGEAHVADAVARAKQLPQLRIGLHLVLTEGSAVSLPSSIPDLVDAQGRFPDDAMARDGARFFFLPSVRKQLAVEIRAQFEAFKATGLSLDHVDAHRHFHLHPTILSLMLSIGRDYGMHAMRWPSDAQTPMLLRPWMNLLRWRLRKAGVGCNDQVEGLAHSGGMDEARLLEAIGRLAPGITEIYLHPATVSGAEIAQPMASYRHADELAALLSPKVRDALNRRGIARGGFSDFFR